MVQALLNIRLRFPPTTNTYSNFILTAYSVSLTYLCDSPGASGISIFPLLPLVYSFLKSFLLSDKLSTVTCSLLPLWCKEIYRFTCFSFCIPHVSFVDIQQPLSLLLFVLSPSYHFTATVWRKWHLATTSRPCCYVLLVLFLHTEETQK